MTRKLKIVFEIEVPEIADGVRSCFEDIAAIPRALDCVAQKKGDVWTIKTKSNVLHLILTNMSATWYWLHNIAIQNYTNASIEEMRDKRRTTSDRK